MNLETNESGDRFAGFGRFEVIRSPYSEGEAYIQTEHTASGRKSVTFGHSRSSIAKHMQKCGCSANDVDQAFVWLLIGA